jgi:hemolysin activation/secretion protein
MKIRNRAAGFVCIILAAGGVESVIAADVPNIGTILQQIPQSEPATPTRNKESLPRPSQPEQFSDSKPFLVSRFEIDGNTVFSKGLLHALVADQEGQSMGLGGLMALAQRISDYYQNHGYSLTRAIIPAQKKIVDGVVRIQVVEARVGRVKLNNKSEVDDAVLQGIVTDSLKRGELVKQDGVERAILLISDLPGVSAESVVKPGGRVGESDLDINVKQNNNSWFAGRGTVDTAGGAATGRLRLSTNLNWINPLHQGDLATINTLSSTNLKYASLNYESALTTSGMRAGASLSNLNYSLGGDLAASGSHGTAQVLSGWFKYPWQRSLNNNLSFQIQLDHTNLEDDVDTASSTNIRHLNALVVSAYGDHSADGRSTLWRVSGTSGSLVIDDPTWQVNDLNAANAQGHFSKLSFNLMHLQTIVSNTDVFVRVLGQKANVNLDSSQKLIVGGPNSVRAYDVSTLAADGGFDSSFELRRGLGAVGPGQVQGVAFFDYASININSNPWPGAGVNSARLMGAGLGMNWTTPSNTRVKFSLAKPIGTTELVTTPSKARGWLELSTAF